MKNRMRAGDWSAAIDGYKALSDDYDWLHDRNKEGSDSFINKNSQIAAGTGTTNSKYKQVFDLNGDGVYHGGMIGNGMDASVKLAEILKDMGY